MTPGRNYAFPGFAPGRTRLVPSIPLEDLACAAIFAFFSVQGSVPGIAPSAALEMTASAPTGLNAIGGILSQALVNALILVLILRRPRLLIRRIATVPWLALVAVLAVASTAWSLDPLLTLRRSIPFALAGLFGLYFATRFPAARQLRILRIAMLGLALLTIAIVVLVPNIGLDHSSGHATDWQGVFTQKNACGRIMVLASAVILFGSRLTPARLAALTLFVFVLIMSGSHGAWIIEASVLTLWFVLRIAPRTGSRARVLFAVAVPISIAALATSATLFFSPLMHLLGRDATLSGRTAIWAQSAHSIAQRPLLGYGYDAFWRGMTGPSLQIDTAVHFVVEHAHNGFLEICLELGITGLALFVLSYARALFRLWPLWRRGIIVPVAFPLVILVLIALCDLDENTFLIYNGIFWPLYVAGLTSVEIAARNHRHAVSVDSDDILSEQCEPRRTFQKVS
jgi:exopolysaccharide production protein ExoQ